MCADLVIEIVSAVLEMTFELFERDAEVDEYAQLYRLQVALYR